MRSARAWLSDVEAKDARSHGSDGTSMMVTRARQAGAVERGMLQLIRLVLADDWDQASASRQLVEIVPDPRILRRMANRVESAIAERASEMDRRAALTLRAALRAVPHHHHHHAAGAERESEAHSA